MSEEQAPTPQQDDPPAGRSDSPSPTLLPLLLLETLLKGNGSWGVTELANALGLPKARVHRHVSNLRQAGFLSQNSGTRRYEPGWRLVLLGQHIEARAQLVSLAKPVMRRMRDQVSQTIVFSQLTDAGVTVTEVLPGGSPIDVVLNPGTQFSYNSSAQGKVGLAFASPDQLKQWGGLLDEQRTPSTVVDQDVLWQQIGTVRRRGWASAPEETYRGINTVAAPVFSADGGVICTLAVVASIHYLPDPPPHEVITAVTTGAAELSREFGHGRPV
ncbi:IclR family transcriptional regulator [Streptomyces sp. SID10853]|uniref:IclR family transcriptional regulator n=1 Tax=Streptomyces sp. SID10853 TaxID=2706028 RepID=UPI0013BFF751|nr:IclR family transcriptional regulator [Streptomyces sp. SID10853]NDZ78623.1 IclR family transcriptional regulator [Streptomyces sp. SID10853]